MALLATEKQMKSGKLLPVDFKLQRRSAPAAAEQQGREQSQPVEPLVIGETTEQISDRKAMLKKAKELQGFAGRIHDVIEEELKGKSLRGDQIAVVLAQYALDICNLSFEGLEPEKKRELREKLKQHFVGMFTRKPGSNVRG